MPLITREGKGSKLTITEMDGNLEYLYSGSFNAITSPQEGDTLVYSSGSWIAQTGPLTTIVNISSAQILNLASTPIQLLPAPGINKYYDIEKIILEYTYGTSIYDVSSNTWVRCYFSSLGATASTPIWIVEAQTLFEQASNRVVIAERTGLQNTISTYPRQTENANSLTDLNTALMIGSSGAIGSFTPGDGTMRAIITYYTRTFGA